MKKIEIRNFRSNSHTCVTVKLGLQLPLPDENIDAHKEDDEMIYEKTEGKWAFDPKTGLIYFK